MSNAWVATCDSLIFNYHDGTINWVTLLSARLAASTQHNQLGWLLVTCSLKGMAFIAKALRIMSCMCYWGVVKKLNVDQRGRFFGSCGTVTSFSGGGVFDSQCELIGICRGSKEHMEFFAEKSIDQSENMTFYASHADLASTTLGLIVTYRH